MIYKKNITRKYPILYNRILDNSIFNANIFCVCISILRCVLKMNFLKENLKNINIFLKSKK